MSGKRLLDLAALFNASRGIAQKHVALRTRQLDAFNKTSTLAAAVRHQTERITETAKAASFLASRLNESSPAWTSEAEAEEEKSGDQPPNKGTIPSRESVGVKNPGTTVKDGLEQDHFYERSAENSTVDVPPTGNLNIQQEKAEAYPLPDGTIPPAESNSNTPKIDQEVYSERPRNEAPKNPLVHEGFEPASSAKSTIPRPPANSISSTTARTIQRQSEHQIPSRTADSTPDDPLEEGHDEEVFYQRSGHTSPVLSSLPRVNIPKHVSDSQEGDSHLPVELNQDTYYHAGGPRDLSQIASAEALPEQEQIPEGINTDVFFSPRVAQKLGGKTHNQRVPSTELKLRGAKDTPIDHTKLAQDKDQDSFNVLSSTQKEPTIPKIQTEGASSKPDTEVEELVKDISGEKLPELATEPKSQSTPYELRESKVPSSRLGRLWNYGGLAAGMFGGAVTESLRRVSGGGGEGSWMLSAGNMDRLVSKLSQMRGAALKLGQVISFQDSKMLPPAIQEVLQRVQDRADYMPASQRNKVLAANLGPDWRELFSSFEETPLAAASIGQVHSAVLKSNGARVAVKVQYPGVADSINSDLSNIAILLTASRLLPKGLFLDKTIANARTELAWECDYVREAECGRRFEDLLADEKDVFLVPKVYDEASGKQVLTMEFMEGVGVTRVQTFSQEQKDWIGTQILRLCLREITEFRYMQTDPNWTNFLYNAKTHKLELLDFGASREYPEEFITRYVKLLEGASRSDRGTVRDFSIQLGYLTGHESKTMLDAHITSVLTLAEPFLESSPEVYDFRDQTITDRVRALIPIMIKERLAPPPEETYSLHRKLSGAFLLCAKLGSRVRCRELFQNSMIKAGLAEKK